MFKKRILITLLSLSASGFVGIATYENYKKDAYIPVPGDVPTIGFGTTEGVKLGDTITVPKALGRALTDVSKFEGALKNCVRAPLHQHEYDAYVSLMYNIGATNFCGSTLVKKLNAEDYEGACLEIKRWNRQKGKVLDGLVIRREREYRTCIGA